MDIIYVVAEEYLDKKGIVCDSHIIFDTDSEEKAQEFAKKHTIRESKKTQVAIWKMVNGFCRDTFTIKNNFAQR